MKVLVINSGSSSVKYQFLDMDTETALAYGVVERIGFDDAMLTHKVAPTAKHAAGTSIKETSTILDHNQAISTVLKALTHRDYGIITDPQEIDAVGHRVVHGGEMLTESVRITDDVKQVLEDVVDLAPLHNPPNLTGIRAAESLLPGVPQVAVFDTAFHATMPRTSFLYALPYALYKRHRIRRYGFHGTSHRYVSERYYSLSGRPPEEAKIITCHLGNGASACAILGGNSFDTSMGFTPLEGLVMGTRSGDVDAGVLPFVMSREDLTLRELSSLLNKHSGLRGISGISGDMRQIEEEITDGDPKAQEAFDIFEYRLRKYIGGYTAAMNGVDAIIFTGGIGENSWRLREAVCNNLTYLGVHLDPDRNKMKDGGERRITIDDADVEAWVIPTNEELVIARDTVRLIEG